MTRARLFSAVDLAVRASLIAGVTTIGFLAAALIAPGAHA